MSRDRRLLLAQRTFGLPRMDRPPEWLDEDELRTWHELLAVAPPGIFLVSDTRSVAAVASYLALWRSGCRDPEYVNVRDLYRQLGMCFIPMGERRRLLFPEKQPPVVTAVAVVSDVKRAIALLAEANDEAVTRTAHALTRWLAGEAFDSAAGLAPGWRHDLQQTARDKALRAVLGIDPHIKAKAIANGVKRAARIRGRRPDGLTGYFYDLRADADLGERTWRDLVAQIRGKCNGPNCREAVQPFSKED